MAITAKVPIFCISAATSALLGYWVIGYYYDDTKSKDGRPLTNKDFDKVSTDHPVEVIHRGGYTSYYNSKAMQMAGLTKNTPPHNTVLPRSSGLRTG